MSSLSSGARHGVLFVCATPIGNLQDVTLRVLDTLRQVDLIAAEDTRVALKLLNRFGIRKPLISYHQHSSPRRTRYLLERLRAGASIALVCNAGTPGVSDPGVPLVREALKAGVQVVPVPGPSAVTAALSVSGMDGQRFLFLGFLPRNRKERQALLEQVRAVPFTLVLYESPHRLRATLHDLWTILGDRTVTLCRELTKVHEEIALTTLSALHKRFENEEPVGEFTLVIEGAVPSSPPVRDEDVDAFLHQLLAQGWSVRDAAKETARRFSIPRAVAYRRALQLQR
ncbi:Ribosomal RNA small subunit methyltransferase I [bacterium HR17]|uniref:Ribosomal RNA small subunit methyltransferase I n=1 Tax=Candidatus Fervidibacter japonicus TaxID=2035412 RepID=A0A2H5XAX6_9BACT|nr:Ribosomal RNA small subunit methyltransferase I [bacterium HR17]